MRPLHRLCTLAAATLLTLVVPTPSTAQQGGEPTAARAADRQRPMVSVQIGGVPQILEQWPETALARLYADVEVEEAVDAVLAAAQRDIARRQQLTMAAIAADIEMEPWQASNLMTSPSLWRMFEHPVAELRGVDLVALEPRGDSLIPRTIATLSCLPRYEGRWTQSFDELARKLQQARWFEPVPEGKVGGLPAFVFRAPEDSEPQDFIAPEDVGLWLQHLPGRFVYGSGSSDPARAPAAPRDLDAPEFRMTLDLRQYMDFFTRLPGMDKQAEFLGTGSLAELAWVVRFDDGLLLEQWTAELDGEPTGIVGAVLTGTGKLPAQALPDRALLQLRTTIDFDMLLTALREMAGPELEMSDADQRELIAGLTGGVALGVTAPAPGGLIPRIYLSLGIADEAALRRALADAMQDMQTEEAEYDGHACTLIKFDDVPQGVQPAFCIHDGVLHVAESGRSLRALLKAQTAGGASAMDVGDAQVPDGPGELVTNFDLRFDEVELYRAFHDIWLPLYALAFAVGDMGRPALTRDDMPSIDVIEEHCGKSRGVMRRDGNRLTIRHRGVLGGPVLAGIAMTWGPMLSGQGPDYTTEELARKIATKKLQAIWPALEAFHEQQQRWPVDLGELCAAAGLAEDALFVTGDDLADVVELPGGGTIRSSFRYFPEPVSVEGVNQSDGVLMIEIRPRSWGRGMLDVSGNTPTLWGDDSTTPIDKIGK